MQERLKSSLPGIPMLIVVALLALAAVYLFVVTGGSPMGLFAPVVMGAVVLITAELGPSVARITTGKSV